VTELYHGREQTQAKHLILKRYLEPFAHKILSNPAWPSIDFIDGFSGPWENVDTENLSDTSIGVALTTLSKVASQKGHTQNRRRIRCIFNESNPASFERLSAYAKRAEKDFPLIEVLTFKGKFENNAAQIRAHCTNSFHLLFVDPTGYTGFPPSSLQHFRGRSSEIIVNFMRSFIERFVSGNHEDNVKALVGLVGTERAENVLSAGLTIELLEREYLAMLKDDLGYKFAALSPIHNPDKNEIHFDLMYCTNHYEGLETMRKAEEGALSQHDRNRFKKSIEAKGGDLFGGIFGDMDILGPYQKVRKQHLAECRSFVLNLISLSQRPLRFSEVAALTQQDLFLKRSEIGSVVVQLANEGLVVPTWKKRNGRKPNGDDPIVKQA